jgi:hypothetical protein
MTASGYDISISIDREEGPGHARDNQRTSRILMKLRKNASRDQGSRRAPFQPEHGSRSAAWIAAIRWF